MYNEKTEYNKMKKKMISRSRLCHLTCKFACWDRWYFRVACVGNRKHFSTHQKEIERSPSLQSCRIAIYTKRVWGVSVVWKIRGWSTRRQRSRRSSRRSQIFLDTMGFRLGFFKGSAECLWVSSRVILILLPLIVQPPYTLHSMSGC